MTRIYIENNELELTSDITNEITYSIDDIKRIENKATSFSKTIIIAGTNKNNQIFGNIFELSHANFTNTQQPNVFYNFDASKSAAARIDINGLQVMKGVLRLLSIVINRGQIEYEVAIFGELTGFISNIAVKRLEDIDFSMYNHQWNVNEIFASWDEQTQYISVLDYSISGPYSSIGIPTYDFFEIEIDVICSRFTIGDTIQVSGAIIPSNNGVFVIEDIFFYNDGTKINIKQTSQQLANFVPENGTAGLTIVAIDKKWGFGYVYPLIDYGVAYPNAFPRDHDFKHFRPALFVKEYMHRIITDSGYKYKSDFFDTQFFSSLIIPNNDIGLEKRGLNYYVDAYSQPSDNDFVQFNSYQTNFIFNAVLSTNNFTTPNNQEWTYVGASLTNVKITAYIQMWCRLPGNSHLTYRIIRRRNNTDTELAILNHPNNSSNGIGAQGQFSGKMEITTAIEPNDIITIRVNSYQPSGYATPITVLDYYGTSYLKIEQDPAGFIQYTYNEFLDMNKLIPRNVYQKDFFLSIVKMFNLMIVEDRDIDNLLIIEPYIDFHKTDSSTYIDWSYKADRGSAFKIMPMSEANSRIYEFKYKEDNDYYNEFYKKKFNETYGNRIYDNQLEFSKDKSSVELIFSPTLLVGYEDEDKVISTIYKYDEGTQIKKPQAHNIRILQIKKIQSEPWNLFNGGTQLAGGLEYYLYAGHLDDPNAPIIDINWGAVQQLFYTASNLGSYQYNLFYNFYSPYMSEIVNKDSRLVTCNMYLNERDIYNLDFSRLIHLDGVLFRLQKVADWSESELCNVSLLRVINTKYFPEAPITNKALILKFIDITLTDTMISGNRYNVNDWSAFFNTTFHRVIIYGQYVYLWTTQRFAIPKSRFTSNDNLLEIIDNIGCIEVIRDDAFKSATSLQVAHFSNLYKIDNASFIDTQSLYRFSAPTCIRVGNQCFAFCINLIEIDLSNIGNDYDQYGNQYTDFFGDDLNDNQVFNGITQQNITIKMFAPSYYASDADMQVLTNNNYVNHILVN